MNSGIWEQIWSFSVDWSGFSVYLGLSSRRNRPSRRLNEFANLAAILGEEV